MEHKVYKCDKCDNIYNSHSGLWKHKIKIHNEDRIYKKKKIIVKEIIDNIYKCTKCSKCFRCRQNKWTHEQKCKINDNELSIIKNEYKQLKDEIVELKNNKSNIQ
jgi:hypothetical protein